MPNKQLKITTPKGQVYTASNDEEIDAIYQSLADAGEDVTKFKLETITPISNETTVKDRLMGALGMGAVGAGTGALYGGGVPGALIGGGVGGALGAAFPPKTKGEWTAALLGGAAGGPLGRFTGQAASKAPAIAAPFIRGGIGLAEAEAGKMLQTGIDTGKPEGFNPASGEGLAAMLLPNVANSWKNVAETSPGVLSRRAKNLFPMIEDQLTNKNLTRQATQTPFDSLSEFAFNKAKPAAKTAQAGIKTTTLDPLDQAVSSLEVQKQTLEDQLKSFTANSATGPFSKTQQYLQRDILLKELETVDEKLGEVVINRAKARQAAIANSIAKERAARQTKGGMTGKKLEMHAEQGKENLAKERWKEQYLLEQEEILKDDLMPKTQKNEALKILDNKYRQVYNNFDKEIKALEVDKRLVQGDINEYTRSYTAAERNLQTNKKYQAKLNTEEKALKVQQGKIKSEIDAINQQEKEFYAKQKEITGVDLEKVQTEIKTIQEQLSSLSVLPPNIKKIVQSGENVDTFVENIRSMRPDDYSELLKYIPPAQRNSFNNQMGDAVVFDFFVKSFDPKTGQFSRIQNYINKYGLPNVEQFYGVPGGQEKFAQIMERLIKSVPQGNSLNIGDRVRSYLTGATIRGAAYQGLYMLFGTSKIHSMGAGLKVAATGGAALAVATPVLIKSMLKNEKLANDFIRFIDSGGTLTYSQLPYLGTFIKNESKPIGENELTDVMNFQNELAETSPDSTTEGSVPPASPQQPAPPQNQLP